MRIDDHPIPDDEEGLPVGRGARYRFGTDHSARPRAVLDHHRRPLRAANLLRQ
jgi:hypothetical protein